MSGTGADNSSRNYLAPFRNKIAQNLGVFVVYSQFLVCTEATDLSS